MEMLVKFCNRLKKIVTLSVIISLMPAPASAWMSPKDVMAMLRENTAAVTACSIFALIAGAFGYLWYSERAKNIAATKIRHTLPLTDSVKIDRLEEVTAGAKRANDGKWEERIRSNERDLQKEVVKLEDEVNKLRARLTHKRSPETSAQETPYQHLTLIDLQNKISALTRKLSLLQTQSKDLRIAAPTSRRRRHSDPTMYTISTVAALSKSVRFSSTVPARSPATLQRHVNGASSSEIHASRQNIHANSPYDAHDYKHEERTNTTTTTTTTTTSVSAAHPTNQTRVVTVPAPPAPSVNLTPVDKADQTAIIKEVDDARKKTPDAAKSSAPASGVANAMPNRPATASRSSRTLVDPKKNSPYGPTLHLSRQQLQATPAPQLAVAPRSTQSASNAPNQSAHSKQQDVAQPTTQAVLVTLPLRDLSHHVPALNATYTKLDSANRRTIPDPSKTENQGFLARTATRAGEIMGSWLVSRLHGNRTREEQAKNKNILVDGAKDIARKIIASDEDPDPKKAAQDSVTSPKSASSTPSTDSDREFVTPVGSPKKSDDKDKKN